MEVPVWFPQFQVYDFNWVAIWSFPLGGRHGSEQSLHAKGRGVVVHPDGVGN
jgi:hypothetical protein